MKLNFVICLVLFCADGGSHPWEKSTASVAKMEKWLVNLLPLGKPKTEDNMV